jgi:glycosyltransferase involved in cell wall biosynthesis
MSSPFPPARPLPRPVADLPVPVPPPRATRWPIIAFCHLPWDGVWQRPQQLLSRIATRHPVLFVETCCSAVPAAEFRVRVPAGHPQVTILTMHLPAARWADGSFIDRERHRLLAAYRTAHPQAWANPVLWFNDPMAVTAFAGRCGEQAIVYDCMDELTQFAGAPPQLAGRERDLLASADVVFCGGRKMREKRLPLNPNCHFYGTGVDDAHFAAALDRTRPVEPSIARLPGPVLGYFGVVDERLDYELITRLADDLPDCSVAMVGPTAKIDPARLPVRPNLHWLGARPYAQLPDVARGFTICLMPFARNAATEYINPTKALEYFSTGRPVVSTALDEVKTNFGDVCHIADNHRAFIAHCWAQVINPDEVRIQQGRKRAAASGWEAIVEEMLAHVAAVLPRVPAPAQPSSVFHV